MFEQTTRWLGLRWYNTSLLNVSDWICHYWGRLFLYTRLGTTFAFEFANRLCASQRSPWSMPQGPYEATSISGPETSLRLLLVPLFAFHFPLPFLLLCPSFCRWWGLNSALVCASLSLVKFWSGQTYILGEREWNWGSANTRGERHRNIASAFVWLSLSSPGGFCRLIWSNVKVTANILQWDVGPQRKIIHIFVCDCTYDDRRGGGPVLLFFFFSRKIVREKAKKGITKKSVGLRKTAGAGTTVSLSHRRHQFTHWREKK